MAARNLVRKEPALDRKNNIRGGWLARSFAAVAILVQGSVAAANDALPPPSPVPVPVTDTDPVAAPVCVADLTAQNVQSLTGFTDLTALQQGSALIRAMNGKNGTPMAVLAILEASEKTGVAFDLLIAKAIIESRLGVFDAPIGVTGSARGVFQFMPATWLVVFHHYADRYGQGQYAALAQHVKIDSKGVPSVADPALRDEILALRSDDRVAAFLKAVYLQDVESVQLRRMLKRAPEAVDYYMLHLLGAPRTARFFNRMKKTPNALATGAFKKEARFNRGVFYNNKGRARTYRQVYQHLGALMQNYIDVVRDAPAQQEKAIAEAHKKAVARAQAHNLPPPDKECIVALVFGQNPPAPALPVPPLPTPRPPQEEIDKILQQGRMAAFVKNDFKRTAAANENIFLRPPRLALLKPPRL